MSLHGLLNSKDVRAAVKPLIRNPGMPSREILVERTVGKAHRVGTALDYLVRFGLASRFEASMRRTMAEHAARIGATWGRIGPASAWDQKHVGEARERLMEGTSGDMIEPETAGAAMVLARFEIFYRSHQAKALETPTAEEEINELIALFEVVPWDRFEPKTRLVLNPAFGEGSSTLGGADADIVLDHAVLEIKTVNHVKVGIAAIRQAVCYALLANRYGLDEETSPADITSIGFYLSRSAWLDIMPLSDCIDPDDHGAVLEILLDAAERRRPSR